MNCVENEMPEVVRLDPSTSDIGLIDKYFGIHNMISPVDVV